MTLNPGVKGDSVQKGLAIYLLSLGLFMHHQKINTYRVIGIISTLTLVSCGSAKPAASGNTATARSASSSPEFINNVSIQPGVRSANTGLYSSPSRQPLHASAVKHDHRTGSSAIEEYSSLQFKYAILLDAAVEDMNNERLLGFIDEWYGTKYRYGGVSKEGIDCSAFAASLMASVFDVNHLPRMSKDQYDVTRRIKKGALQEGDLVFFHTLGRKKSVTHVGIYLRNNKFVHASISGVMISSIEDGYYAHHYVGAGRAF